MSGQIRFDVVLGDYLDDFLRGVDEVCHFLGDVVEIQVDKQMAEVVAKDCFALVMEEGGVVVSLSSDEHQPKQQGDVVTSESHDGVYESRRCETFLCMIFYPKFLN